MTKDYKEITRDISAYTSELRKLSPDAMQGFYALAKGASADGALDKKTKELIALAIGITQRCDGCIGFHAKALKELGATRQEIAEVMAMSVYMGGGPALMYAADALRAYDQFSAV
ncbi:carboxymuconolactone decarboxylase family protein [Rhizobium multihospitium]|uniref:Alkylhydroperoxidase AhpD family core domain-containing protein n=1 Tax=Rhizobium multihospitium TaxID=410764 RepID=A0A1C3WM72_9HYPH|nr:carboxymuconolactone decarboxylase family protein [Rhizobium multihospitium]SCB41018.1 alkylhydroperoxidase AhpD family core domain-containing protein [Rhizobium multihospitium]